MKGNCDNCALRDCCTKEIGYMFGFCNTDFVPIKPEKRNYKVSRGARDYIRCAENAIDAIELVAHQYGWGRPYNIWMDAETRGLVHASADLGGGEDRFTMFATVIDDD